MCSRNLFTNHSMIPKYVRKPNTQYVINDCEVNTLMCLNLWPACFLTTFVFEMGRYWNLGIFNWLLADL
jgi:hypothetical protein